MEDNFRWRDVIGATSSLLAIIERQQACHFKTNLHHVVSILPNLFASKSLTHSRSSYPLIRDAGTEIEILKWITRSVSLMLLVC
jgi:hypothetical protein